MLSELEANMGASDTPAARQATLRQVKRENHILIVGAIGLVLWFPPLIYLAAIAYVATTWYGQRADLWLFAIMQVPLTAVYSAILVAAIYATRTFWDGIPAEQVIGQLKRDWLLLVASATLLVDIVHNLFYLPRMIQSLLTRLDG